MAPEKPRNRILATLPQAEWQKIRSACQPIELVNGQVLIEEGEPFAYVYFPEGGIISTVSVFETGQVAEIAATGHEGMVSIAAVMGGERAYNRSLVQMPGSALMMDIQAFRRMQGDLPVFRRRLRSYARVFLGQIMQSVACNGVHSVEERCARWLLMARDRSESDELPLTQEFLAQMLGVSRPAVNLVARTLQAAGLIRYRRGEVSILDRQGLEDVSCECYRLIRQHYQEYLTDEAA